MDIVLKQCKEAMEAYRGIACNEAIIECGYNNRDDNRNGTGVYLTDGKSSCNDSRLDYLQIIRPLDSRMSTKNIVDVHVRAFKKLQVENDLVLILISLLN